MTLPNLPRRFQGILGVVRVVRPRGIVCEGIDCDGLWEINRRTISVRAGLTGERAWWVFHHEKTHADLDDTNVELPDDLAEAVCNGIATARVAEMLRRKRA